MLNGMPSQTARFTSNEALMNPEVTAVIRPAGGEEDVPLQGSIRFVGGTMGHSGLLRNGAQCTSECVTLDCLDGD